MTGGLQQSDTAPDVGSGAARASYPRTRRVRFRFADGPIGKYFVDDDIVFSHFVAGLSGGFPPGEESFIRSVRRFADQISDPGLRKRVAGFIGQESTHGQEHRRLNGRLIEMGYRVGWYDRRSVIRAQKWFEQKVHGHTHLAMTAAAEHYTAVLAERVLTSDELQALPGDPEVWNLINWHALEELEHKSVAFDVYRATGGSETRRIAVMAAMMALTLPFVLSSLAVSVACDRDARRRPLRLARETHRLLTGPLFRGLTPKLAQYLRPGFHPDDIDTTALLDRWRAELFGTDGALLDHLK